MKDDMQATLFGEPETDPRAQELEEGLAQFYGGDEYYRHWLGIRYTEGVKFLADKAGAQWLIDAIASYQPEKRLRNSRRLQEFQLWELKVDLVKHSCVLTCKEDDDYEPVVTQEIEYTDFPLDYMKLWLEGGVLLLPSEH